MNKVILKGNVGNNPDIKTFDWGKVAKFSLATTETRKKGEETVKETTWHSLVFYGNSCDIISKYVHKGDQLLIEGKIVTRTYEKNGQTHWSIEIVCDSFEFCGGKKEEDPKTKNNKVEMKSLSNADDLPQHIKDAEENPNNLPF